MKKLLCILLVLCMTLPLGSCGVAEEFGYEVEGFLGIFDGVGDTVKNAVDEFLAGLSSPFETIGAFFDGLFSRKASSVDGAPVDEPADYADTAEDETPVKYSEGLDAYYSEDLGGMVISGPGSFRGEELVVPPTINGYPVVAIGEEAFYDWFGNLGGDDIRSVIISEGVQIVGVRAFFDCETLESVTLPESLLWIGGEAFGQTALKSIYIPKNVNEVYGTPFRHCYSLVEITVDPENPVYYSESNCIIERNSRTLVAGCKTSEIPYGVLKIGQSAFEACPISYIDIPSTVREIDWGAFQYCINLVSVRIPYSVTSMDWGVFDSCYALRNIYCEVSSKPSGWNEGWAPLGDDCTIRWGQ